MHDSLMDNVSDPRLENVLGSVAVAITGAVQAAVDEAAGHTAAGPAALTALRIHRGCSVDHLAGVLGLTHSGTVRLVDRLEDDGLLQARAGAGRTRRHARAHGEGYEARGARLGGAAQLPSSGSSATSTAPSARR